MRTENWYQLVLIGLGVIGAVFFGVFLYREIFPEYQIYQNRYLKLEEIRAKITGQPVPVFEKGVKQIVIPATNRGPETIDRCISCHVALQINYFSPTKPAKDIRGNLIYDKEGKPVLEKNEEYIWDLLPPEDEYLKTVQEGEYTYDVTKALRMHPLIGKETRPFEYHPMEEYGCTSCHNGNGRGLVTDRAHGPIFDGQYEIEPLAKKPSFLEKDPLNDPEFSKVFNDKPGPRLLFQTTPLFVGNLIEAKCVMCHQPTHTELHLAVEDLERMGSNKEKEIKTLQKDLLNEQAAVLSWIALKDEIKNKGAANVYQELKTKSESNPYPQETVNQIAAEMKFLNRNQNEDKKILQNIENELLRLLGSKEALNELQSKIAKGKDPQKTVSEFIEEYQKKGYNLGTLFVKANTILKQSQSVLFLKDADSSLKEPTVQKQLVKDLSSDADRLTRSYQRGQELYVSQACYACHKIEGFSRGGVGPELTEEGKSYPWFIKESIVWPQADLPTSVMPNMRLDHVEIEDLMTFLLAQRTDTKNKSRYEKQIETNEWEGGKKVFFEKPIPPSKIQDMNTSMKIFASEGCAACHRLKGFESNVGYQIEKENPNFEKMYEESLWFQKLFPEAILGSQIVKVLESHQEEIDQKIKEGIRRGSILEEIEKENPGLLESYYSNFKFASRSKKDQVWKDLIRRVMMMYIQEYGLGRQIGPKLNWSGIYRSDQWLMEHFWNPQGHSARSIMPIFPFDNTKFLSLIHLLNTLGINNRDEVHKIWKTRGFNPDKTYQLLCSQCHGDYRQGNGPVAEWIYPIPKNLNNSVYFKNLTKENAKNSIVHGIKGGPMPPWGEIGDGKEREGFTPMLNNEEVDQLIDWIFSLPAEYIEEQKVLKWEYEPKDILKELNQEKEIHTPPQTLTPAQTRAQIWDQIPVSINQYQAALQPRPNLTHELTVDDVFECIPEGIHKGCYVKKKWYTEKNIKDGEDLFLLNCSICHGRQGDGSGLRAGTMTESKPRMLTNLDWLGTRDDLRLLRSIKYGVPGTAMPAWGDVTSAWQRLQLVVFIRSLTEKQVMAEGIADAIYKSFDQFRWEIEAARAKEYAPLQSLKEDLGNLKLKNLNSMVLFQEKDTSLQEVKKTYDNQLEVLGAIQSKENKDQILQKMLDLATQERTLFKKIGDSILNLDPKEAAPLVSLWIEIIQSSNVGTFAHFGTTSKNFNPQQEKLQKKKEEILSLLNERIDALRNEKQTEELNNKLKTYQHLEIDIKTAFDEIRKGNEQAKQLYKDVVEESTPLPHRKGLSGYGK